MKIRNYIPAAWIVFAASGLLVVWQLLAYLTNSMPNHILSLVRLLSGTMEAVPVAYAWTIRIGVISSLACLGSLVVLICAHLRRR